MPETRLEEEEGRPQAVLSGLELERGYPSAALCKLTEGGEDVAARGLTCAGRVPEDSLAALLETGASLLLHSKPKKQGGMGKPTSPF